jgi:hypothetical protein
MHSVDNDITLPCRSHSESWRKPNEILENGHGTAKIPTASKHVTLAGARPLPSSYGEDERSYPESLSKANETVGNGHETTKAPTLAKHVSFKGARPCSSSYGEDELPHVSDNGSGAEQSPPRPPFATTPQDVETQVEVVDLTALPDLRTAPFISPSQDSQFESSKPKRKFPMVKGSPELLVFVGLALLVCRKKMQI